MKKQPTRPDLLARFQALGVSCAKFEKANGLPANMIPRMRQGAYSTEDSRESITKLEAALVYAERGVAPPSSVAASANVARPLPPRKPTTSEQNARDEFSARIRGATTPKETERLADELGVMILDGVVTAAEASALKAVLSEKRLAQKATIEAEARAKAGEEEIVRVVLVPHWDGTGVVPILPPLRRAQA